MSNFLIDEDTGLLAAEFVLGTLDSEERTNAQSLLRTDHGFIAMVRIWERRFGELHLMVEPIEPDAQLFQRIKAKIAAIAPAAPAAEATPRPQPADATGSPPKAEAAPQPEASSSGEEPKAPDAPAAATPADVPAGEALATAETEKSAETPPAPDPVAAGEAAPTTAEMPATPPPAPLELPDKLPDRAADGPARGPDITINVIRSRGRWRVLGVCMTVLVMGLVGLLAAWRFIPDRVPARLRPAELMTSIGIQALPPGASALKPALPEAQFDE
jgi:hypothetical protein